MTMYKIYDADSEVTPLAEQLWCVTNCFGPDIFHKLSQTHTNYQDRWHRHHDCLEYRLQLTPDSPTLLTMSAIGDAMLPAIEGITGQTLARAECKMWLDLSGWHCPYHEDDPLLIVTYQVFLWQHGDIQGTEFLYGPRIPRESWHDARSRSNHRRVGTTFVPNTGYINLNTDNKLHHCANITGTRLSAAWQFRRKV